MTSRVAIGRRLVLGSGVYGAFLLPAWLEEAVARTPPAPTSSRLVAALHCPSRPLW